MAVERNYSSYTRPKWVYISMGIGLLFLLGSGVWVFQKVKEIIVLSASLDNEAPPQFGETGSLSEQEVGSGSGYIDADNPAEGDAETADKTPEPASDPTLPYNMPEPWDGAERVNILVMGVDIRCDEEGPTHTDSMILVSIDPIGKQIATLSLPRDIWVDIPGFGADRINQAHWYGEGYEYAFRSIYLLQQEVAKRGISIPEISDEFSKNDYVQMASEKLGMHGSELNNFLWTTYHPSNIWIIYAGVAVSAVVLLWLYDRFVIGK